MSNVAIFCAYESFSGRWGCSNRQQCQRTCDPWILYREENWEMIDTVNGANSSAIIYSIAETAKANNLKPFDYFEYLLTEIPKHVDDKNIDFLAELLPWSDMLPENIRKPQKASGK